jgi:hypothetical protein
MCEEEERVRMETFASSLYSCLFEKKLPGAME